MSCKKLTTCNLEAVSEPLIKHLVVGFNSTPHHYTVTSGEGGGRKPSHPITVNKWLWLTPSSAHALIPGPQATTEVCITQLVWLHEWP